MKTIEFIKRVQELGYEVVEWNSSMKVYKNDNGVASISTKEINNLNTFSYTTISTNTFGICAEYTETPIEDREEVKKYYLIVDGYNNSEDYKYFNYNLAEEVWFPSSKSETESTQTKFTQEEIDNHKYSKLMKVLRKVEVR